MVLHSANSLKIVLFCRIKAKKSLHMLQAYYMYLHGFKCHKHNSFEQALWDAFFFFLMFLGSCSPLSVFGVDLVHTQVFDHWTTCGALS